MPTRETARKTPYLLGAAFVIAAGYALGCSTPAGKKPGQDELAQQAPPPAEQPKQPEKPAEPRAPAEELPAADKTLPDESRPDESLPDESRPDESRPEAAPAEDPPGPSEPTTATTPSTPAALAPEPAAEPAPGDPLQDHYLGTLRLGVNRVTDGRRTGIATISKADDDRLRLQGSVRKGRYSLKISGTVEPVSERKFHLQGQISGVPDLSWRDEAPRARKTVGRFTFEATKGRRYWRMYKVNGRDCVCHDGCGNDFCYIDLEFPER